MSKEQEGEEETQETYESDCEDLEDYKKEGYHPVYLKEQFFNGRYYILQKLGWGHFSTVWLAEDKDFEKSGAGGTEKYVALKIQKSKESYSEAAADEIQILKALKQAKEKEDWAQTLTELNSKGLCLSKDDTFVIELINNFVHFGMHGKHYCSTFHIMGPNLLDIMRFFEKEYGTGIPIHLVKKITIQLLIGLDFMHRMGGVIHTDLKPENVMIDLSKELINEIVEQLKNLKVLPLSMKFLKNLQSSSGASKNKKKKKKKKAGESDSTAAKSEPIGDSNSVTVNSPDHKSEPEQKPSKLGEEDSLQQPLKIEETIGENGPFSKEGKVLPTEVEAKMKEEKLERIEEKQESSNTGDCKIQPDDSQKPGEDSSVQPKEESQNQDKEADFQNEVETSKIKNELEGSHEQNTKNTPEDASQGSHTQKVIEGSNGKPQSSSVEIIEENPWENHKLQNEVQGEFSNEESQERSKSQEKPQRNGFIEEETHEDNNIDCFGHKKDYTYYWKEKVKVHLNDNIKIKLVDLGNACWTNKHFTDNIQTREYRSPEAILGSKYEANTDMWSLACMIFELLTGDYLFRPESDRAEPRDELHLALFISTLGKIPKKIALEGKYSREVFNKSGKLLHATVPEDYPIDQILTSEYGFNQKEATEIRDFLMPMLEYDITKRVSAKEALNHPWLWSK